MKQIPTITQVKQALQKLAEQKKRPDYELCTAKEVKCAFELGLDHPLTQDLLPLIEFRPVKQDVTYPKSHRVSQARLVKKRQYPTKEQARDLIEWLNQYKGRLVELARHVGCANSTLSLIRSGARNFSLETFNKINDAIKRLESVTEHDGEG